MSIPRPKILTRFNFTTSQAFKVYISVAGQFDTAKETSIGASASYFVSGDGQTDDLLFQLGGAMSALINSSIAGAFLAFEIDTTTGKIMMKFDGCDGGTNQDVRVAWSECGTELAAALGFDTTDDDLTGADSPTLEASWPHGFGWYASEDGQLEDFSVVDTPTSRAVQARALSGHVVTQDLGTVYDAELKLQFIERTLMFSDGLEYLTAPVQPYTRNKGLECWFHHAKQGIEFRVYRDGHIDTNRSSERGTATGGAVASLTDAGRAWSTDPLRWLGRILYVSDYSTAGTTIGQSWYISTHTATVLTVPNKAHGVATTQGGSAYHLFDHPYSTYVLDVESMPKFLPRQTARGLDRYDISIPLWRYVS